MRIAFAGNPNSGKTTMYNALTGRSEKVGNWAGVTVASKEYQIKPEFVGRHDVTAVDLPGAYSMSPFTPEESITSEFVRTANPDAIVNIVDATNLSRSLFFTTQLLELGIPVVVALNKSDINAKEGTTIDAAALAEKLNCPVFETTSTEGKGLKEVIRKAVELAGTEQKAPYLQAEIELMDKEAVEAEDRKRFEFVNGIVGAVEKRAQLSSETTTADKVDSALLNPILGIVIFAAVDTMEYLVKGGRISKASGLIGDVIGIKPIVTLEQGKLVAAGKAHGSKKSHAFLSQKIDELGGIDYTMPYAVGYSGTDGKSLQKYLDSNQEILNSAPHSPDIVQIGSAVGTHCGSDAVLVTFFRKAASLD